MRTRLSFIKPFRSVLRLFVLLRAISRRFMGNVLALCFRLLRQRQIQARVCAWRSCRGQPRGHCRGRHRCPAGLAPFRAVCSVRMNASQWLRNPCKTQNHGGDGEENRKEGSDSDKTQKEGSDCDKTLNHGSDTPKKTQQAPGTRPSRGKSHRRLSEAFSATLSLFCLA